MTVAAVLKDLESLATAETRAGMARFGIPNHHALGVTMRDMRAYAKARGKDHLLAGGLWQTGIYEARTVAAFMADPKALTPQQMDQWAQDFDNWAICDTVCYHLFDRSPHAWDRVRIWAPDDREFVRRAAYALIWSLSVHDKHASQKQFVAALGLIEQAPADDRPLVKKAMDMALRAVGKRDQALNQSAIATAKAMSESPRPATAWIGRHALKELASQKVQSRWQ